MAEGRFADVGKVFSNKAIFWEVFEKNPQILEGKPLKAKMDELLTAIICTVTCLIWGNLNLDMQFCNAVAFCVRQHGASSSPLRIPARAILTHTCPRVTGIFLPRRGAVAAHERDVAKTIQTKAQSIRNKSGKGLYKATIKISRSDAEHPNFKRLLSLGLAEAGCVQIVDDLPPMLATDEDRSLAVASDFESMAEKKLADAQKMRTEDLERSQECLAPPSAHPRRITAISLLPPRCRQPMMR